MGNLLLDSTLKKFNFYHSYSAWQQWQLVDEVKQQSIGRLVKNKLNPGLVGQLRVCNQINNLENSLKISQFRFDFINAPIVGIYGIYSSSLNHAPEINLCGGFENYVVITEKIKYCFGDMGQISFKKSIQILKSALTGAKLIMQNLNILPIYDETMIFFDKDNNCKIWINPDVNSNYSPYQNVPINVLDCVNSIFLIVEQKTQHSREFREFLQQKSSILVYIFQDALELVIRFDSQQILPFYQHHKREQISYQGANYNNQSTRKKNAKLENKSQNENSVKKSLSVKKVKKQTDACVFFSAKKSNNRHSEDNQTHKPFSKQLFNPPLIFNKFTEHQKPYLPLFSADGSQRNADLQPQVKTQHQFYEQRRGKDLKKRIIDRNDMKDKFIDSRVRENEKSSKPASTLSTQYDSTEVSSNFPSRMQPNVCGQALQQINFTKKSINRLKYPNSKIDSLNLVKNFIAGQGNQSGKNSTHRLESCFSDRKDFGDNKCEKLKKYISDQNIPILPKSKKVSITGSTPKLSKQSSMPNFHRIHPLLSA